MLNRLADVIARLSLAIACAAGGGDLRAHQRRDRSAATCSARRPSLPTSTRPTVSRSSSTSGWCTRCATTRSSASTSRDAGKRLRRASGDEALRQRRHAGAERRAAVRARADLPASARFSSRSIQASKTLLAWPQGLALAAVGLLVAGVRGVRRSCRLRASAMTASPGRGCWRPTSACWDSSSAVGCPIAIALGLTAVAGITSEPRLQPAAHHRRHRRGTPATRSRSWRSRCSS